MSAVDWSVAAEIFADARELAPGRRAVFIAERCAGRPEIAAAVERLLAADQSAGPAFPPSLGTGLVSAAVLAGGDAPERLGPWRLLHEIGQGGMGRVFLAERVDGQFDQRAAVKLLKRGMDSDAILARFLRERQILAGLDHPNIARLLDGGVAPDGRPWFVMEHVDGEPITRYADGRRLPVDDRLDLFHSVCLAVEYAHRNLVVHRDLKPSNILVTRDGRPKLLDFGIAKLLTSAGDDTTAPTDTGLRLMTPEYAAPEQFDGGPITTLTDVYGLGAVLYELLGGCRPRAPAAGTDWESRTGEEEPPALTEAVSRATAVAVAAARSTDPARLRRRLTGDLETILATALRSAPQRRYPSVAALREDVRRHQELLPVRARPDTRRYRLSRFVARHRGGVLAAAVVAVLLVAFALTASLQARRISEQAAALSVERDRARQEAAAAQQVADFLVGVFDVADPMQAGLGDSIRARELLDRGAERIGLDLAGQPALEARMLSVIGRAYDNLGRSDDAERLVQRAAELQLADPAAPPTAAIPTLQQLARVRTNRGEYAAARDAIDQAIAIQQRIAPAAPMMVALLADLVRVLHGEGDLETAAATADRAMALFDSMPSSGLSESPEALARLTSMLGYARDWERMERVHARRVEVERAAGGPLGEGLATAYIDWGRTRRLRGDLTAGDSMLTLGLEIRRALAPRSPATARAVLELAAIAADRGMTARADSLYHAGIDIYRERLGDDHQLVAIARSGLASALDRGGRSQEAIPLYELAIASYRTRSEDLAYIPVTEWRLAQALRNAGRPADAAAMFERALRGHEARFPPGYILTTNVRRDYGRVLLELHRADEAEPLLSAAVAGLADRWGEGDERVEEARVLLERAREERR